MLACIIYCFIWITYGSGAVLAASSVGLALLVEEVVGNGDDIDVDLGALAEEAETVGNAGAVANGVASRLVGSLVTAVNALAVGTRVGSLLNGKAGDRGTVAGGGDGGGQESDDSVGIHFEGCSVGSVG